MEGARPLQYWELLKESKMSETTFNRWLETLCEGKIVKRWKFNSHTYYSLGKWGELVMELERSNDFWGESIIFQIGYEKELNKRGV